MGMDMGRPLLEASHVNLRSMSSLHPSLIVMTKSLPNPFDVDPHHMISSTLHLICLPFLRWNAVTNAHVICCPVPEFLNVHCHTPNTFGTVNMGHTVNSRLSWSER